MDKKDINKLVMLYFKHNPQNDNGVGWRVKANQIITKYANELNMSYDDIKHCIESQPMCPKPIWTQFYEYYGKYKLNKDNNEEKKSSYKNTINDSTDVDDWL